MTPLGPTVAGVLTEALGDPDDRKIEGIYAKEGKALFGGVRVMNKTERFRLVRRALKVACGIALHGKGIANEINWDRGDAFACLVMSAALLHRSLQLQERSDLLRCH